MTDKQIDRSRQLIINSNFSETRVALLEGTRVAELSIERKRDRGMVGNIYKGVVTRVLPGMQSAFIDIGAERTAFLFGGDAFDVNALPDVEADGATDTAVPEATSSSVDKEPVADDAGEDSFRRLQMPIETILRDGQEIIVQVAKDPLGSKGARVTMYLAIPGRYLVIMPDFSHVGVSRRITDEVEKERLKSVVRKIKPEDVGVIVRTAALGVTAEHLEKDLRYLLKIWKSVKTRKSRSAPATMIYEELDLILKTTRDLYSDDMVKIVVDDQDAYEGLKNFLSASIPGASQKLEHYTKANPIFDEYGIEIDIARALSSKVWLPSGGYLVIEQTEALTSFDVNTGKFVGHLRVQDTILKTNLEAVKEIVAQLRVRNIGGIIVIDFIDMEREEDREMVYNSLQEDLKRDKAKANVLKISELGLVQMTRKRTSESLERTLTEPCPYCDGRGRILSTITETFNVIRDLERYHIRTGATHIRIKIRDDIRIWLQTEERQLLEKLKQRLNIEVDLVKGDLPMTALHAPSYELEGVRHGMA